MKTREQTAAFLAMVSAMSLDDMALTYCTLVNAVTCCKEPGAWGLALCTAIESMGQSIDGKASWEAAVRRYGRG